jgi:riboflavin synthase
MFTGIVQAIGEVRNIDFSKDFGVLEIAVGNVVVGLSVGDSVSVNGVCLTASNITDESVTFEVMGITLSKTNLGTLTRGSKVNLELPLTLQDFVGGHLVQGHVDEVGTILEIEQLDNWKRMRISTTAQIQKFVVARGSIAVDGVSLTVSDVDSAWLEVSLIPTTLEHTILGTNVVGDKVNLESDIIARHVEKLVKP